MKIVTKKEDVHPTAYHPEELVQVMQSVPEAAHVAEDLLRQHSNINIKHIPRFPRWRHSEPDRSIDLEAMAKSIFKKHSYRQLPKLGGGLSDVVKIAKKTLDPLSELHEAHKSYNRVNLKPKNLRQFGRSAAAAYSGNFHVGSAYLKGAAIVAPEFAAPLLGAAAGFSGVSKGFDKFRNVI